MQWEEFRFNVRHLSEADQATVARAFTLGEKAHTGQKRKSGEPYFSHPIAVAHILADLGGDCDTIVAGLLHDTVEDTPLTLGEISLEFGPDVATLIDGVTKLEQHDVADKPNLNEQIETLRKMFTLMQQDVRIMVIKLADRMHNMQTLGFMSVEKQLRVARETMDVYVKIADRLCMRDMQNTLESLCLAILEPELYEQLRMQRTEQEAKGQRLVSALGEQLRETYDGATEHIEVHYEQKSWYSLSEQIKSHGVVVTGIASAAMAIVCNDVDQCYRVLGALHQEWQREILSFQDFINSPMINGYRGLHTTIILKDGTRIRCKIRTKDMQEYAHRGVTVFCFNNASPGALSYLPWTQHITAIANDTQDRSTEFWEGLQSDILGSIIVVHGPDDRTVMLPSDASALDAAFYLFGQLTLRTTGLRMNGKTTGFDEPVRNAATIDIEISKDATVARDWLSAVKTGVAIALIREGLSQQDRTQKVMIGRELLERYLSSTRNMFLAELQPEKLDKLLQERGLLPLEETSILLAEGRMNPEDVARAMFPPHPERTSVDERAKRAVILCDIKQMQRQSLLDMLEPFAPERISFSYDAPSAMLHCKLVLRITDVQQRNLIAFFENILHCPYSIRSTLSPYLMGVSTGLLVVLWGVDPVFARLLLSNPELSPIDLHFIRFASLSLISGLAYVWARSRQTVPEAPLTLTKPSLWFSVILLIFVSLFSYLALGRTLPSDYSIPMTAAGLFVTSIVNRKNRSSILITWLLTGAGIAYLILQSPEWHPMDIVWTLLAVASFSGFSVVSEQYKRTERISARVAQYFFLLSVFCTLFSLPLLPFSTLFDISPGLLAETVLFCMLCTALPYYIYYTLLTHREIDFILRFSFLIIPMTIAAQLVAGIPLTMVIGISALLVLLGASLPLLLNRARPEAA